MKRESSLTYKWFDQVWNKGNEAAIDELLDEQASIHGIEGITEKGSAGFKVFHSNFLKEFSNLAVNIGEVVAENGMESCHCDVTATQISSGRTVHFTGQTIVKIENGKIMESWNNFDFLFMYQQLGFALRSEAMPMG